MASAERPSTIRLSTVSKLRTAFPRKKNDGSRRRSHEPHHRGSLMVSNHLPKGLNNLINRPNPETSSHYSYTEFNTDQHTVTQSIESHIPLFWGC